MWQNNCCLLLPLFRLVLHTKLPFFSEINPVPPYFFALKILPMESSSESQSYKKKIMDQMFGYISFCFEIRAHLGHLFA